MNHNLTSIFRCVCGEALPRLSPLPDWAHWLAFPCASWSAQPSPRNQEAFLRVESLPEVGSVQWLSVTEHFAPPLPGHSVWVLFRPPWSDVNGWDGHPEELPLSGLVRVELVEVLAQYQYDAWLSVRVLEVRRLTELAAVLPPRSHSAPLPDLLSCGEIRCMQAGELAYCWCCADDSFEWVLCQRHEGQWSLLMHSQWGYHSDALHVGHRTLSAAEGLALGLPDATP